MQSHEQKDFLNWHIMSEIFAQQSNQQFLMHTFPKWQFTVSDYGFLLIWALSGNGCRLLSLLTVCARTFRTLVRHVRFPHYIKLDHITLERGSTVYTLLFLFLSTIVWRLLSAWLSGHFDMMFTVVDLFSL